MVAATGVATFGASITLAPASEEIIAMTAPTCTTSFSLNNFLINVPSNGDGISVSTLSVAISKRVSSSLMESPSFFVHLIMVASATLSPILGIVNSN